MEEQSLSMSVRAWMLVLFLFLLGVINFADKAVIGLAAPNIIAELHLSATQWGFVGSSFFLLFSFSSIVVTAWSDRIGPKKVLAILAFIWSIVQIGSMLIISFLPLIISRIILGAGEGPFYGTSTSAAARQIPSDRRGFIFALLTFGSATGPAILAPLLALLLVGVGWRATFGLLGVVGIVWVLLWLLVMPELRERKEERVVQRQMQWKYLFSLVWTPNVIFTILAGFAGYWYLALLVSWVPQYFIAVWHLKETDLLYLLGISLPWLVGGGIQLGISLLSDRLVKRGGSRWRVYVLFVTLILGTLLLVSISLAPNPFIAIICLSLSPLGATFPLVAALLAEMAPAAYCGTLQGFGVGFYSLAGLLAPAITGILIQHALSLSLGFDLAYLVTACLAACFGILCWLFVKPVRKEAYAEMYALATPALVENDGKV